MALRYINARIKNRRDSRKNLTENNPLLYDGELCFESDTLRFKLGNAIDKYNDLPYVDSRIVPIGSIIAYSGVSIPDGYLLCNGQAVSRTTYSELYAVISTKFGSGDGSTTFNVPNLTNRFIEGTGSSSNIAKTLSAGLPNITGKFGVPQNVQGLWDGCFYVPQYGTIGIHLSEGHSRRASWMNMDASRSSSLYGKSNTVQPPAIMLYYIIRS